MLNRLLNQTLFRRQKTPKLTDSVEQARFQFFRASPANLERRIRGGDRLSGFSLHDRKTSEVANPFYVSTGQAEDHIIRSINPCPFDQFWEPETTEAAEEDTVDHQRMRVRSDRLQAKQLAGTWHVKTPGNESVPERLKRNLQKLIYRITGQRYKAEFYNDKQLLAQKEVMAGNVYKAVMAKAGDPQFQETYQMHYSINEKSQGHCIASRHLEGYLPGSQLVVDPSDRSSQVHYKAFRSEHNPATNLVIRRFLLGDEDYLKLDNYMFAPDPDPEKADEQRLLNIDFGMAFYSQCKLPEMCDLDQFQKKIMRPSAKHFIQYRGKHTMHSVIAAMNPEDARKGIKTALQMIANLTDEEIEVQTKHIHQPDVRKAMAIILKFKRDQAAAILYPEQHSWPQELGRNVINSLVGRYRQT